MGAYYSVVRYLPNPLSEEFLNFGILTFEGDDVRGGFLKDWDRLRRFGDRDVTDLRQFAARIQQACEQGGDGDKFNESEIRRMAEGYIHRIQLSVPAGSVLDLDALLKDCTRIYLPEQRATKPQPRSRVVARSMAANALGDAMRAKGGDNALQSFRKPHELAGQHDPYRFAAVVSNGVPRTAVDAFSLEVQTDQEFFKSIKAAAYSYGDVREANPQLEVAVLLLEPPLQIPEIDKATSILRDAGSRVVTESDLYEWADEAAEKALSGHNV